MRRLTRVLLAVACVTIGGFVCYEARSASVPEAKQDRSKVFYGSLATFEKPAEIQFSDVVQATEEFQKIKKKKVRRGTGEYWILMEKASARALQAVTEYAKESEYDLVTAAGYLRSVDENLAVADVTEGVVGVLEETAEDQ